MTCPDQWISVYEAMSMSVCEAFTGLRSCLQALELAQHFEAQKSGAKIPPCLRHFEYVYTSGFRAQAHHYPGPTQDEKTYGVKPFRSCPQISHLPDTKSQGFVGESHRECQSPSKSQEQIHASFLKLILIFDSSFLFRLVLLQPGLNHRRLPGRGTCHGKDFITKKCS